MTTDVKSAMARGDVAIITDIQRYSVHDGPGIRTLVFFKGCPLRCQWCHNPETHSPLPELLFHADMCIGCGACLQACPNQAIFVNDNLPRTDPGKCTACGQCAETCYAEARAISGETRSLDEVFDIVMRDEPFYHRTGGGITLSGGEVLAQPAFAARLLERVHAQSINTAIETCGYGKWETFEKVLRHTDLVLFDIKHSDPAMHRRFTGVDNRLILDNLSNAAAMGKAIIARVPLIPAVNDTPETLRDIAAIARGANAQALHILPFHQIGSTKWDASGREYKFRDYPEPEKEDIDAMIERAGDLGLPVVVGGN